MSSQLRSQTTCSVVLTKLVYVKEMNLLSKLKSSTYLPKIHYGGTDTRNQKKSHLQFNFFIFVYRRKRVLTPQEHTILSPCAAAAAHGLNRTPLSLPE